MKLPPGLADRRQGRLRAGTGLNRPLLLLALWLSAIGSLAAADANGLAGARALYEANKNLEAQRSFERLLATEPGNADVHYYLGQLAMRREDTDTAVRELEKAVALAPDSARNHGALGDAYGRSAEKGPAIPRPTRRGRHSSPRAQPG